MNIQSEFSFDKLITGLFGKPIWKQCICYSRNINTIYLQGYSCNSAEIAVWSL